MNWRTTDLVGVGLTGAIVGCALAAAVAAHWNPVVEFVAAAIVLAVIADKRKTKIVTASLFKVCAEDGGVVGIIGCGGEGLQIGVRADSRGTRDLNLWGNVPHVSFTFGGRTSVSGGKPYECAPALTVRGNMAREWTAYTGHFSYERSTSKPRVTIAESRDGLSVHRDIAIT